MGSFLCDRNVCMWGTVISSIITDIVESRNAIKSCEGAREEVSDHFVEVTDMIVVGKVVINSAVTLRILYLMLATTFLQTHMSLFTFSLQSRAKHP
jgi:hypothetical protein